ncbi:MAG TPA: carbohydrate ABC transporter permease [Firmicutes bacterium]|nr:carbohydrate ABC transporter permease [Bacillota bacterium]
MAAFMLLPLVFVVVNALKPIDELLLYPPRFWVQRPTLANFGDLVLASSALTVPFIRYVFNSVFVTVTVVGLTILVGSMAAYALSNKHRWPGQELFFTLVVSALMFAPEVTSIPRYLIVNRLGWIDHYWALIIPPLASTYAVFLMKQFIDQVPREIIEASIIDGATDWTIFWKIIMPFAQSAWATLGITSFVATWNDAFSPLIFTRTEVMKTLPLMLQTIGGGIARAGAGAAATFLMIFPPIIIFTFLQSRVVESMAYSGIKS